MSTIHLLDTLHNLLAPFRQEGFDMISPKKVSSDIYFMDETKIPGHDIYVACHYSCKVKVRRFFNDLTERTDYEYIVYDIHIHDLDIAYPGMDTLMPVDRVECDLYNSILFLIEDDYLNNKLDFSHFACNE